jgi:mannose-1-phosphate guanylyltransferase
MILCAGYGTRLGVLGEQLPKPLLPVANVPIVRYGIALLVGHGIRDIVINLHYRSDLFEQALGDGSELGARIHYSREPRILGSGGGIKHALGLLDPDDSDEPFVVMNGKLIIDADLTALLAAHRAAGDVLATLLVRRVPDASNWGAVRVDERSRVRDVLAAGDHMFCGVHIARPSVIRKLPDGEACFIRQGYLPWLTSKVGEVAAHEHHGYFEEHSTPARYLAGNLALLRGAELRYAPDHTLGVAASAVISPSARIVEPVCVGAGARIGPGAVVGPEAVVGPGAVVAPGAALNSAVAWPSTLVDGIVENAIVSPAGLTRAG